MQKDTHSEWMPVRDLFRTTQRAAREELLIAISQGASGKAIVTALVVTEDPKMLNASESLKLVAALKNCLPENSLASASFERFMRIC